MQLQPLNFRHKENRPEGNWRTKPDAFRAQSTNSAMIPLDEPKYIGKDLHRPECVLCTSNGTLHVAHWRDGVTLIAPNRQQQSGLARSVFRPKPNEIDTLPEGGWLLAHLGDADGGVYQLSPDGTLSPVLPDVDGQPLPLTKYEHLDGQNGMRVIVITRKEPQNLGYRPDCDDRFVVRVDNGKARIVADGLGYTNECLTQPETGNHFLYKTFARRLTRFDVDADGSFSNRKTLAYFGPGIFPVGLAFNTGGGIWITLIFRNKVIRVTPDGLQEVVIEDANADDLDRVEQAHQGGEMGRSHLDRSFGTTLRSVSRAAFCSLALKIVYLGRLLGSEIATFTASVSGIKAFHLEWAR